MKAFLRLMGGVCAVGKLSVQALSRTYKIVGTARKRSLMMPACRRQECERLVINTVFFSTNSFSLRPLRIQKSTEKNTCNSRVTGKWGLRRVKGIFWCFFTAKICIKKCWKFRYRYLFSSQNGAYEPIRIGRPLRGLKPYTVYLITLKILFCVCLAHARQSSSPEAAHGVALSTDSIKPLQIGDTIPEALWHMPLQTVKAGRAGSTTVTLNDYRGKLIILDFWATWCTACVAAMPDLHQLQAKFETELKVLSVTYEPSDKARQFLENNKLLKDLNIGSITDDNMLKKYFYHKLIPHCVWIDQKGVVRATTRPDAVNAINVSGIIDNQTVGLKMKRDIDAAKPLFLKGDLLVSNKVRHHSIFIEETYLGLPVGPKIHRNNNGAAVGLALCNIPLLGIYDYLARKLFAGKGILYSSKDRYIAARDTTGLGMVYTISLSADTVADMNRVYKNMLNEVNRYSGWKGMIEKRKRNCYVLRHTAEEPGFLSGTDSLKMNTFFKSKPGDAVRLKGYPIKYLVAGINSFVFGRSDDLLVDATGIKGPVDLTLQLEPGNVERLIAQLKCYNLTLTKEEIETDVFVIRKSDL
ncbi:MULTISPECIES: TlpA family protein disulfide reductase [Olivibacter]|uniref:TlpA family protein disulfide reductase n=1 Tax=Olivibacter jilunii TaxID=985016 RepID=A0ABW6B864_9SPHI